MGKNRNDKYQGYNGDKKKNDNKRFDNQSEQDWEKLLEGYLENGYYSDEEDKRKLKNSDEEDKRKLKNSDEKDKRKLKKEYVLNYSKGIAVRLANEGGNKKNKRSQIRKYYDYCIRIKQKLEKVHGEYSYVEADVAELVSKAKYAMGRKVVTGVFVEFIEKNVATIKDARDYAAFLKHFEAVVAFMKDEGR